jgi:hypothetical protein
MNKTFEEDDKVIIIREYNEAENPHCLNDILEFLRAMKNELQTKLDTKRKYFRDKKLEVRHPSGLEYIRVPGPGDASESVYHMRVSTKNLNLVNQMIEHVLASDKKMFAVVFDKDFSVIRIGDKWNNVLTKPRIVDIKKTYIDVRRIEFSHDKLFHLSDIHKANGISIKDDKTDTSFSYMNDFHLDKEFNYWELFGCLDCKEYEDKLIETNMNKKCNHMFVPISKESENEANRALAKFNSIICRCKDCLRYFLRPASEIKYYESKDLELPRRCLVCREIHEKYQGGKYND